MLKHFVNDAYPVFRKDDLIEIIHGKEINDPYRWLEDSDREDVKDFVERQNALTFPFLNKCQYKDQIKETLTNYWDFPSYGCIKQHGDYFYYFYNSGLQNQSVLYRLKYLDSVPDLFLDPNEWSEDGTVSLALTSFTEDGKLLAFGQSSSGHDWVQVKFLDTETGQILPDELQKIKFSSVEWTHDNKGVFYSCFPDHEGKADGTETTLNINHKLMYHRMGTEQSDDILCYEIPEEPKWLLSCEVSDCGRYLILSVRHGCERNVLIYLFDLNQIDYNISRKLDFKPLVNKFEAKYEYIINDGSRFLFQTDKNAPMYKVVEVNVSDLNNLMWNDLIPSQNDVLLNWVGCANNNELVVCYQRDVVDSITLHSMDTGQKIKDINFPLGTISAFSSRKKSSTIFMKFSSFLIPGINYKYDLSNDDAKLEILQTAVVKGADMSDFCLKQVFYQSKDGTKIPMFIMHHKNVVCDGNNPCRLYGYGGFDISIKPAFNVSYVLLMKHFRFVCAIANIRGGGEYGETWHNSGRLKNKQNCFDDFIAAAEYLIQERYSSSDRISIEGGSNGGLLVAACMNQRPDLFGAVICHVGVLDMLRFHKFTIGHAWVSDYGDPDNAEHFEWIIKYSPLHNIKKETQYPACLLLTADHDDRVVPLHSMKFIAQLQEFVGHHSERPIMIRFDVKSGHGSGKPTSKRIDEICDVLCFLQIVFNLDWFE